METKSNQILVGAVTLLLLAVLAGFTIWLSRSADGDKRKYDIFFQQSVNGLAKGSGVSFSGVTATVTSAGVYKVSYCVEAASNSLASSRIVINGSQIDALTISPVSSRSTWCRSAITSISAAATVNLQLFGILGAVTLTNPGGASLQIQQVGAAIP